MSIYRNLIVAGALLPLMSAASSLDIEERRVAKATQKLPDISQRYQPIVTDFIKHTPSYDSISDRQAIATGNQLWQRAINDVQQQQLDDRPLYWSRLQLRAYLKELDIVNHPEHNKGPRAIDILEKYSRGFGDINYQADNYNVLVTGFDPFFLDRNIGQSNPSGVVALALDNLEFEQGNINVHIETVLIPVRFSDFDQGLIEKIVDAYVATDKIDMLITVSMGREQFDLERFPALNRSAKAPDNQNFYTGASKQNPQPPKLNGKPLEGAQFVEFSLPAKAMMQVKGPWQINDNHQVATVSDTDISPTTLSELDGKVSVAGSGGGYLSNEISYRSIRAMQLANKSIPIGHIHTPKINEYNAEQMAQLVEQTKQMILAAIRADNQQASNPQ